MYESEVNNRLESVDSVPSAVLKEFEGLKAMIEYRTALPWGEHCTECAWPTCYTTCELYDPRMDGNCRLFVDGMVRIDIHDEVRPYLLKLRFKRWGKLWTVGNLARYSPEEVSKKEKTNILVGALGRSVPLPKTIKSRVLLKIAYMRRCAAEEAVASKELPETFLLECYNPASKAIALTLTIRPRSEGAIQAFRRVIQVPFGVVRAQVPVRDILKDIDLAQPFEVEIVPNEADDTVLYFGLMEFVWTQPVSQSKAEATSKDKQWKCIVWDLDNTLWEGTLIEDGPERIRVREDVVAVIKETDRRGILHSIASKNNYDDAFKVLQSHNLDEYFLHPQIAWTPKSQSIARIAQVLNIGIDSLAFVDDQVFEREEVRAALPQVAVVDANEFSGILTRRECQVPVTDESQQRRIMYRQEEKRKHIQESFEGDYTKFLRECRIELALSRLSRDNMERVYELAQRTNQMNFSGSRYPREQLDEMRTSTVIDTYVMRCVDRFGSYGIVGFAVVDSREPRLLDLMFSCRIQGKRVEHAFLAYLLEKHARVERRDFFANYKKTKKNESAGKVFDEIGFTIVEERDGTRLLRFSKDQAILNEEIVAIVEESKGCNT